MRLYRARLRAAGVLDPPRASPGEQGFGSLGGSGSRVAPRVFKTNENRQHGKASRGLAAVSPVGNF